MIKEPDFASALGNDLGNKSSQTGNSDESEMTLEILEFFTHQPTFNDFCQMMILDIFADKQPWGACVGVFQSDGRVRVLGSFGIGEGLLHQYEHSSYIGMPRMGGLFVNGIHVSELHGEFSNGSVGLFELLNSHGPNAVGLIKNEVGLSGFVQVLFMHPVEPIALDQRFEALMRVLRILLPIYRMQPLINGALVTEQNSQAVTGNHQLAMQSLGNKQEPELSDRQIQILKQVALGKTNAQIAREIGFSESTVRQETIDIYRKLEVSDRKRAVLIGQSRGIIPIPEAIGS